jgi:transcription elongation factor GreB
VSKAFTKDDDQAVAPLVPRRAPLPAGVPNYVTERGLAALRAEFAELSSELARARAQQAASASEQAQVLAALNERAAELEARIGSAEVVRAPDALPSEIRFGARVTVRSPAGAERTYQIVGVDEADAGAGRIAFIAPLARALLGKRAGESALVHTPHGEEELEIVRLEYAARPR